MSTPAMPPLAHHGASARTVSRALCGVVAAGAVTVLLGWIVRDRALAALWPGGPPVPPDTAAALLLLAAALVLAGRPGRWSRLGSVAAAGITTTLAVTSLAARPSHPGLDRLASRVAWGTDVHITMAGALGMTMLGVAVLLLGGRPGAWRVRAAHTMGVLVGATAMVVVAARLLDTGPLRTPPGDPDISLAGSIGVVVAAAALLCLHLERGPFAVMAATGIEGRVARRAVLAALVAPLALGTAVTEGRGAGLYGDAYGTALLVVLIMPVLAAIGLVAAGRLGREERAHRARAARDAALVASIDDPLIGLDRDWRVSHANDGAAALLGRPAGALTGAPLWEVLPAAAAPTVRARLADAVAAGRTAAFTVPWGAGGRWADVRAYPFSTGLTVVVQDATARVTATRRLREQREALARSEQRLALALEGAQEAVWDWDLRTGACHLSETWPVVAGHPEGAVPSGAAEWFALFHPDDDPGGLTPGGPMTVPGAPAKFAATHRMRTADETWRWYLTRGRVVERDDAGAPLRLVGTQRDVHDRVLAEQARDLALREARTLAEELRRQASADPLTGLLNTRVLQERLAEEVRRAARHDAPLTLAILDVDHFKAINDTHGHLAGDGALREIARRLRGCVRQEDVLARVGGEEFAWLMPHTGPAEAHGAVSRALGASRGRALPGIGAVTLSAGIATLGAGEDGEALYRRADAALYRAKAAGRDRTHVADGGADRDGRPRTAPAGVPAPPSGHRRGG